MQKWNPILPCSLHNSTMFDDRNGCYGWKSMHGPWVQDDEFIYIYIYIYKSKKWSKLRVTGLCVGNSPVTREFPAQIASNADNVSIWWRHHIGRFDRSHRQCLWFHFHNRNNSYLHRVVMFHKWTSFTRQPAASNEATWSIFWQYIVICSTRWDLSIMK